MASATRPNTEAPEKVFDTSGIAASLTKNNLIESFDNAQNDSKKAKTANATLDNQADGVVNLNGIPVSPSTGTARIALMQTQNQK